MLSLRSLNRFILIGLALLGMSVSSASAAILNVDGGGNLMGASGVSVGGALYDVEFADGSCVSLFDGCDSVTDFTFNTMADASLAATALLRQVFLDTASGAFDSNPALTNGCNQSDFCAALTVADISASDSTYVTGYGAFNREGGSDKISWFGLLKTTDTTVTGRHTYAIWSESPSAVPVSAAIWLFGTALDLDRGKVKS